MAKVGFTRFKGYKKSGAMGYVPEKVYKDDAWPFKEGEVVKVRIDGDHLIHEKAEWWEMLDWNKLPHEAYDKLPPDLKAKIKREDS